MEQIITNTSVGKKITSNVISASLLLFFLSFYFAPSPVFKNNIYYLFTILPSILVFYRLWLKHLISPFTGLIIVFGIYMSTTALWPSVPVYKPLYKSLVYLVALWGLVVAMQIVIENKMSRRNLEWAIGLLVTVATIITVYCAIVMMLERENLMVGLDELINAKLRLRNHVTHTHPNELAWLNGAVALIAVNSIRSVNIRWQQVLLMIATAILFSSVFLTQSRGALLASIVTLAIYILLRQNRKVWIAYGVLVLIVASLWVYTDFSYFQKLFDRADAGRFGIYETVLNVIKGNEILGVGILADTILIFKGHTHPHSMFMSTLMMGGIVGFVMMIGLVVIAWWNAISLAFKYEWYWGVILVPFSTICLLFDGYKTIGHPRIDWLLFWFPIILVAIYASRFKIKASQSQV